MEVQVFTKNTEDFARLESVSIESDNPEDPTVAMIGDTITLSFTSDKEISNVRVYLDDKKVENITNIQGTWIAQYTIEEDYIVGDIDLSILYDYGPAVTSTTDGTAVSIIDPLEVVLEEVETIKEDDYTRLSYYLFNREVEQVREQMKTADYKEVQLVQRLYDAIQILERYPLSLYSFEENVHNSFGSSHGTVTGSPLYNTGKIGKAIKLNGEDTYITLPSTHALADYDEITVATWINWRGGGSWQRIFDFGNNTDQYLFLTPKSYEGTLRFAIKDGGGEQLIETSHLPTDEWVHVAVTLGNGTAKLYVNGEERGSADNFTIKPSDFKPGKNYIGASQYSVDPLFNGMLDEFCIYDHVLEAEEIAQLYQNPNIVRLSDKSLLNYLLEKVNSLDEKRYTESSWQVLEAAIADANAVNEKVETSQEEVDNAAEVLVKAMEDLILYEEPDEEEDPNGNDKNDGEPTDENKPDNNDDEEPTDKDNDPSDEGLNNKDKDPSNKNGGDGGPKTGDMGIRLYIVLVTIILVIGLTSYMLKRRKDIG